MFKSSLLAFCITVAFTAVAAGQAPCHAENNTGTWKDDTSVCCNAHIGIRFTPQNSFTAKSIEVFTGEATGTNTVAIWSDNAALNQPGTNLATGSWSMTSTNSWQGATLTQPVSLVGGQTYWMVWGFANNAQSSLEVPPPGNVLGQVYRPSFDGGQTWTGPFQFSNIHYKFRVFGDCVGCAGSFLAYGSGCATSSGGIPSLTGGGCPAAGGSVSLNLTGGVPGASTLLFLGLGTNVAALNSSCSLYNLPLFPIPIAFNLSPNGSIGLVGSLPPTASALDLYFQAAMADAGLTGGVAMTNALHMHVP